MHELEIIREKLGLSQSGIAGALGMGRTSYYRIVNGRNTTPATTAILAARHLLHLHDDQGCPPKLLVDTCGLTRNHPSETSEELADRIRILLRDHGPLRASTIARLVGLEVIGGRLQCTRGIAPVAGRRGWWRYTGAADRRRGPRITPTEE